MENINIFNVEATSLNFGKLYKEVRAGNSCSIFGVQNSARPAIVSGFGKPKIISVEGANGYNAIDYKVVAFGHHFQDLQVHYNHNLCDILFGLCMLLHRLLVAQF